MAGRPAETTRTGRSGGVENIDLNGNVAWNMLLGDRRRREGELIITSSYLISDQVVSDSGNKWDQVKKK